MEERGVMGTNSPQALLNSIFYYNGKGCCLRGGEEHRNLRVAQFQRVEGGLVPNILGGQEQEMKLVLLLVAAVLFLLRIEYRFPFQFLSLQLLHNHQHQGIL